MRSAVNRVIDCTGSNLESIRVQEAILLAESLISNLRGANVAFRLEYEKDDVGTKLVIRTYRENPEAAEGDSQDEAKAVPSEEKVVRGGRRKKTVDTTEGVEVPNEPKQEATADD